MHMLKFVENTTHLFSEVHRDAWQSRANIRQVTESESLGRVIPDGRKYVVVYLSWGCGTLRY